MNVFVTGATGALGRRLVAELTNRGHDVVGLTRDDRGDTLVRERGGGPVRGDVLDEEALTAAAAGADVLVHAATKIPAERRPTRESWRRNDRVWREGAANVVAAAAAVDAERVVLQSVVWLARRADGGVFDEGSTPNPDRSTASVLDAERLVLEGAETVGFEPVVLRCGWFYAPDSAHTRTYGEGLLAGRMPIVGSGMLGRSDATLSYLHVDDAATAFTAAVEGDATGVFHVVDDHPTGYATFLKTFARLLDAPSPRRVPAWIARLVAGREVVGLLTRPMPTTNERFVANFNWAPTFDAVDGGLESVVAEWRATDVLEPTAGGFEWAPS
jgi:nucleoside-diphosphate-sugar epimerase